MNLEISSIPWHITTEAEDIVIKVYCINAANFRVYIVFVNPEIPGLK